MFATANGRLGNNWTTNTIAINRFVLVLYFPVRRASIGIYVATVLVAFKHSYLISYVVI